MNRNYYLSFLFFFLLVEIFLISPATAQVVQKARITGIVVDANGKPATDADVTIVELRRKTTTDAEGEFVLENVPPGRYLLQVESPRMGQALQSILVRSEPASLEIVLDKMVHQEEIIVSGTETRSTAEVYQPADVLTGTDLTIAEQPTLGETLSKEAGVNSTYFGPGASRPVIRGLGGDRIRVLIDGTGVGDASSTSPDHAVSTDPGSTERIEIIRGPATLLYGSSAVGGVVNVFDNRVPSYRTDTPVTGKFQLNGGTVADEWSASGSLTGTAGPLGWHLDAMKRETGDYNIPGFAEEHPDEPDAAFGTLPNSSLEADSLAGGLSYVGDGGFLGFSYSGFNTNYGIPGHAHAHEEGEEGHEVEEEEEESVRIDLKQRRFDVRGEVTQPFAFLRGLKLRVGTTNYEHSELEGSAVGTLFLNDSWETRVEATHKQYGLFNGSFGVQFANRDFSAIGEEAFLPPTETKNYALFLFEEIGEGPVKFQGGVRYENQEVTAQTDGINNRSLNGFSASGGILWLPNDDYSFSAAVARSIKLPNAEELFSNGPHIATNAFEIGDPNLTEESSLGFDFALRKRTGRFTGEVSFFLNRFDDFIFEEFTDEEEDGLPVFRYVQQNANFVGAEFHGDIELFHVEPHHVSLEVTGDYVRAENRDTEEPLPRIPPYRIGAGIRYQGSQFWGRAEVRYVAEQDRVSLLEDPTASYTMVNADFGYRFFAGNTIHDIILRATNLTDEEARNHVSFLKELAPLPGRDFSIIYKFLF